MFLSFKDKESETEVGRAKELGLEDNLLGV